jgi:hypothetical protein
VRIKDLAPHLKSVSTTIVRRHDINHGPETVYPSPTLTAMILLSIPPLDIGSASLQKSIIVSTVPHAALGVNYRCAQGNISPFSQYTTIRSKSPGIPTSFRKVRLGGALQP